jgi:hypothetical protein
MAEKRTKAGMKKKNEYIKKYMREKYESMNIRMKIGERERYNAFADYLEISRNEMIKQAIEHFMQVKGWKG